jgi:glycosyltransferase involved in cell wall biosynthesis
MTSHDDAAPPMIIVAVARSASAGTRALRALEHSVVASDRIVTATGDARATGDVLHDMATVQSALCAHGAHGGTTVFVDAAAVHNAVLWWRDLARACDAQHPVVLATTAVHAAADVRAVRPLHEAPERAVTAIAVTPDALARLLAREARDLRPDSVARSLAAEGVPLGVADGVPIRLDDHEMLLSACLIMKDEEDNIEECLTSLRTIADEIVIHDTGSTDRSVALARAFGARVIEGEWKDDFSLARNTARVACRGRWLLAIDLDEVVEASSAEFRRELARNRSADVIAIPVYNLKGTELAPTREPVPHVSPRLLRRRSAHWVNAIHEAPAPVRPRTPLRAEDRDILTLLHRGYLTEVFARKEKAARNRRIAEARQDAAGATRKLFEVGRANLLSGRIDEGLAALEEVIAGPDEPVLRRVATGLAASWLFDVGRYDEIELWIERRAQFSEVPGVVRLLRARLALARERYEDVLVELDGISDYTDVYFSTNDATVCALRARALAELGRYDEAAAELVAALTTEPLNDGAWALLLARCNRWPAALDQATRLVPESGLKLLASWLVRTRADAAAAVTETLWSQYPGSPVVLALAGKIAPALGIEAAATWSVRLRAAGLAARCPLRAIVDDPTLPDVLRLQAAYLGTELFGDPELERVRDELLAVPADA